jgi:DNA polymerase-3 subunit delta'
MDWPVQGIAKDILKHSLRENRLAHAYLFSGPEGAGQTETARMFAQAILCEQKADKPCGVCYSCRTFQSGNNTNFIEIIPDGTNIKIQQIREIQRRLSLKAIEATHKVYIIHQADTMTVEAANSLLKTLEEPTFPVVAILITHQITALLPTIVSRCQIVPFQGHALETVKEMLLRDHVPLERAHVLAYVTGNYGEAKQWAHSEWFAECMAVVLQLTEDIVFNKGNPLLTIQDKLVKPEITARQLEFFLDCLAWWFRDLRQIQLGLEDEIAYREYLERLRSQASQYTTVQLSDMIGFVLETKQRLKQHVNLQLGLEHMILRLQGVKHVYGSRGSFQKGR